jgi:4-hydroxy-tetrahydrodipicolinate synthase
METVVSADASNAAPDTPRRIAGVLAPVVTPFDRGLKPDAKLFIEHCRWLLANGVGLAPFGTNSEANSLSVDERIDLLDALMAAGIDPKRVMPGTGCCATGDTVRLTRHAVGKGCAGVLMLPPFYYKQVTDEGLYRSFASVIEQVADARLQIYLYHIPPVAQVGISLALIERLLKSYPSAIAGIKDSSGDWNNTQQVLDAFGNSGFDVFVGSETFLLANMRSGGKGAISAMANVDPGGISSLYRHWQASEAQDRQARLDRNRKLFGQYPMIPALKRAVAYWSRSEEWARVRPPLVEMADAQAGAFIDQLKAAGFEMPGR